jgi:light-regulated signal transduction histidine kinase (bacteriophytochrome)
VVGRRRSARGELDERTSAYFEIVAAAVDEGVPSRRELHVTSDDAHELVDVYPVDTDRWALAALDITERVHAEQEVARLNADLELRVVARTEQLEATNRELESFAYAISHDLRAPLRALDGFSEILIEDYGDRLDETGQAHLLRIRNAAGHMSELMDALLQLSRLSQEELHREAVDLSAAAAEIFAGLRAGGRSRVVDVIIAPGLVADCDRRLTRIALDNLIGNAWKYTARRPEARIEVGASEEEGAVVFFVRDDGAGFDMRYADKLFGAFQRLHTDDEFEGTGIGLATVQRIVHRHGGAIWAEGAVDEGATFSFTLTPPYGT